MEISGSGARVSIARCADYQADAVYRSIKESVDHLGGIASFVAEGKRVLLKPNFLIGRPPERCVNTHPAVVRAVAELVLEAGGKPFIGDSPQLGSARKVAEKCGVAAVARDLGIDIVEFEPVDVKHPRGRYYRNFTIGKEVLGADTIINLPKLKTHSLTLLTLAVKNIFGCIPSARKAQWHVRAFQHGSDYFTKMLLDLYSLINPALTIVDGIVAMEGKGPGFGSPRELGLVVTGTDAVAVDAVIAEIIGVTPEDYPILRIAKSDGYGTGMLSAIALHGEDLSRVKVDDFLLPPMATEPSIIRRILIPALKGPLTTRPFIDTHQCQRCSNCMQACPLGCISQDEGGAFIIDTRKCIQCLCCMEVCPNGAVDLKDGFLLSLIKKRATHA